jgi:hypothetical protein
VKLRRQNRHLPLFEAGISLPVSSIGRYDPRREFAHRVYFLVEVNMQSIGFFAWLREGVRRAVLLGFSDAITQIGTRNEGEDLSPELAATLQRGIAWEEARPALAGPNPSGRKRLGKSLHEIRTPVATPQNAVGPEQTG